MEAQNHKPTIAMLRKQREDGPRAHWLPIHFDQLVRDRDGEGRQQHSQINM